MVKLIQFGQLCLTVGEDLLLFFFAHGAEGDLNIAHPAHCHQGQAGIALHLVLHRTTRDRQRQGERNRSCLCDLQVFDHAELNDIASKFGVVHFG
ncbi:hypothetical protein SDC9_159701 [bioreactor metagenome]|uniref:Uncharacterized protein n=1 Tax=bioreactor metagenome TaxID=1076179 RepID=A0A645FJH3_9ZZZZ